MALQWVCKACDPVEKVKEERVRKKLEAKEMKRGDKAMTTLVKAAEQESYLVKAPELCKAAMSNKRAAAKETGSPNKRDRTGGGGGGGKGRGGGGGRGQCGGNGRRGGGGGGDGKGRGGGGLNRRLWERW